MITSVWYQPGTEPELALPVWESVGFSAPIPSAVWTLVLLDDGAPVAAGCLSYISAGICGLVRLAVLPSVRGEGLGDALMKALILKAEGIGMKEARVVCPKETAGFFRTIDFEEIGAAGSEQEMRRELGIGFKCHCANQ